jgi:hypothetical protein
LRKHPTGTTAIGTVAGGIDATDAITGVPFETSDPTGPSAPSVRNGRRGLIGRSAPNGRNAPYELSGQRSQPDARCSVV